MSGALSILLVGDYAPDPTLGSSKVFFKLREEFTALGHRCGVLFADDLGGPRLRQTRQLVSPWLSGAAIARRLREEQYDVVDAASAEGLGFGLRNLVHRRAAFVCRSNGLEHLDYSRMIGDHDAGLTHKPWIKRVWYPASRLSQVAGAARVADRLLLLNETDRQFAVDRRWQAPGRIDVIPHGLSPLFLTDPPESTRGGGLLFCGSWAHVKGVPYLVEAYTRMRAAGAAWPLTILGPGVPAERVLEAFPASVRPCVTVIPRVPESDVRRAYAQYDVLLFPSTYEGFGLVLLEAMSQGMAVVTTPVGCAASLVRDGRNGIVVPIRDPDALATAAARLMTDPAARARLGAAARETVAGMSWRRTAEQTIACYARAIADARTRA